MKKVSLLIVFLLGVVSLGAQDEKITDANVSNYRSWAVGLNFGPTLSLGDAYSFAQEQGDNVPDGVGGFEIGFRGNLTKFINPTYGFSGSIGYHQLSGATRAQSRFGSATSSYWFEGNYIDADLSFLVNLSNLSLSGKVKDRKSALLFGVGLGITSMASTNYVGTEIGGVHAEERAIQAIVPLQFHYKYRLSEAFDFDALYRHTITTEDWPDVLFDGNTSDMLAYVGVGVSYNFGKEGKHSVVYANPLDDMYGDIQSIREDYNKLTGDDDMDGVANYYDKDNATPEGVAVTGSGVALDSDNDGIPNYLDEDPFTRKGAQVDSQGRAIDSDDDGVPDSFDEEPNTPAGALVNRKGEEVKIKSGGSNIAVLPSLYFPFNSANLTTTNEERMATIAIAMKRNPDLSIKLVGHADARGPEQYNMKLSTRRAESVKSRLVQVFGIDGNRIEVTSAGESDPLAQPKENYSINRRVDVVPQ